MKRTKEEQNQWQREYSQRNKEARKKYDKQYKSREGSGDYAWRYKLTNEIVYIGSSKYLAHRRLCHASSCKPIKLLKELFDKNGFDKYEFIILEKCEETELLIKEQEWLNKLTPICNKFKAVRTKNEDKEYRNKKWREMYQRRKVSNSIQTETN